MSYPSDNPDQRGSGLILASSPTAKKTYGISNVSRSRDLDLSQYLGHILVETAKTFSLFLNLQTPVELSNESNYGFDYDYKILQCS